MHPELMPSGSRSRSPRRRVTHHTRASGCGRGTKNLTMQFPHVGRLETGDAGDAVTWRKACARRATKWGQVNGGRRCALKTHGERGAACVLLPHSGVRGLPWAPAWHGLWTGALRTQGWGWGLCPALDALAGRLIPHGHCCHGAGHAHGCRHAAPAWADGLTSEHRLRFQGSRVDDTSAWSPHTGLGGEVCSHALTSSRGGHGSPTSFLRNLRETTVVGADVGSREGGLSPPQRGKASSEKKREEKKRGKRERLVQREKERRKREEKGKG